MKLQIVQYLFNTIHYKLKFKKGDINQLKCYSDSDFANCETTRKSVSGFITFFAGNAICWSSTKQSLVALSSNEAEIIACNEALRNVLYINNMINELLNINIKPTIFTDNKGVIKFAEKGINQRTKHLDIRLKHLFDCKNKNIINLERVISRNNLADIFTKFLNSSKFKKFIYKFKLNV